MKIALPDAKGVLTDHWMSGNAIAPAKLGPNPARIIYAAAHVVADPYADRDPMGGGAIDWRKTLDFRHYLAGFGLGIAEAMDTAQRGMGLDWPRALDLIRQTKAELPDALIANGCGTDHLGPGPHSLDEVRAAYLQQVDAIQALGGRIILMASRALVQAARGPEDYISVYSSVLAACDHKVILHWLGDMFDPALTGYWGATSFAPALETALEVISANVNKVDGIKISLLDKDKEIAMRRRLPEGVKMYTGDDFNYPDLIQGDETSHSHALLGIFDPLAPAAALAIHHLNTGEITQFRAALDPTVPLARLIFRAPTQFYKTGVVFLAWLNGFQDHFIMLGGAQSMRPLPYFTDIFRHADACGLLIDPDLAMHRMRRLLAMHGV